MYEKLYAPIPDVNAYLARLKIHSCKKPDKEFLDELIYAHQRHIIFENLDVVRFHRPISLEIPALFDKIVTKKRGGYCFEMNALFAQLLKDLGYRAEGCMCRIVRGKDFTPPILHRASLTELDGKLYFCDVGYGGPEPPGAVPVEDGHTAVLHGETYHMRRSDDFWWTLSRTTSQGEHENILQFFIMPQEPVNFITANYYCSSHPDSVFTQKDFLNVRTEDGSRSITGNIFTEVKNGQTQSRPIGTEEEFAEIASEFFGLSVNG